ncbi:MAG TPA: ClpXP protease specificity-enhancing factor [Burkholderiaceae bacterium]|nr:ClpXP protease specificity-enhancing factor [Burkholderiaceae bacterium]
MSDLPSTRPYLLRAMHQWCEDNGFTAYIAVAVDDSVRVPRQHVVDGEIVLNISSDATGALVMGNDAIEFKARFGGIPQNIFVPVGRVQAIYARENGQGMAFPVEATPSVSVDAAIEHTDSKGGLALVVGGESGAVTDSNLPDAADDGTAEEDNISKPPRPTLTRIK